MRKPTIQNKIFLLSISISWSILSTSHAFHVIPPVVVAPKNSSPLAMSPTSTETKYPTKSSSSSSTSFESKPPKRGMLKLIFSAEKKLSSKPIAISDLQKSKVSVKDFFLSRSNRNLVLSKDALQTVQTPSSKLMKIWASQSTGFPIDPEMDVSKDDSCEVVEVITRTNFPGLTLKSVSTIGCKLVLPSKDKDDGSTANNIDDLLNAQYQFTLLDSTMEPEGNSPTAWIYNKLVGGKKNDEIVADVVEEPVGSSFTTFTLEKAGNDDDDAIQFTSNAKLSVRIEFPKLLMRILPLSVEKMEEQGSQSMQKTVDKEVGPALERYFKALKSSM